MRSPRYQVLFACAACVAAALVFTGVAEAQDNKDQTKKWRNES